MSPSSAPPQSSETVAVERRLSFGTVAELYDRVRPSYPPALVDGVLGFAPAEPAALEVGAGTGKATELFARRELRIHALEPSAEMASVLRRNCGPYDGVSIEVTDFERFDPGGRRFGLIYSAQAWHWVTPSVRYLKARALLGDGGALAVFWNRVRWTVNPVRDELRAAYDSTVPDFGDSAPSPMHPASSAVPDPWGDWRREIADAPGFGEHELRTYDWDHEYTTEQYLELISTHSDHVVLGAERLRALLDAVREVIDGAGGRFTLTYVAVLVLARAI